ncbi:MAG: GntR family transcriptional regulator [Acidobacteriota bacterium]|nr:GntR family transcriptional regulator [Acidobacteriota bacterium]
MKKTVKPVNIVLDNQSAVPVYEQVKQAIKWSILSGYLEEGDQLPSLRELAAMLRINPNTIVKIYFQLEVEGFISSRAGSGFFVCKDRDVADIQGRKLFEQLSQEYLAKIIALGFSEQDILDYLRSQAPTQISGKSSAKEINNGDD